MDYMLSLAILSVSVLSLVDMVWQSWFGRK